MAGRKQIRVNGVRRKEVDADLMVQVVLILGRELQARAAEHDAEHTILQSTDDLYSGQEDA